MYQTLPLILCKMSINLYPHQLQALNKIKNGSILCGGVGSGKSITSITYFYEKILNGSVKINGKGIDKIPSIKKDLYIITTARKRDTKEWEKELHRFVFNDITIKIDSWNNIQKYKDVKNSFFIFDEQRVVGYGQWSKSFIIISKQNQWILLSATPGDTWLDYLSVFIANGFYKNKTEFVKRHVVYSRYSKYPKIDKFIDVSHLEYLREKILIDMPYFRNVEKHHLTLVCYYDKEKYKKVFKDRWNIFKNEPIKDITELCYVLRRVSNDDISRLNYLKQVYDKHNKVIVFYNFNYELEAIKDFAKENKINFSEWNGQKHEEILKMDKWLYLVQYTAGAEGWNCIETNTMLFYSQNYSYKIIAQACGRIDRLNSPYKDLYYYHLRSTSPIDYAILKAIKLKTTFNENNFASSQKKHML